MDRSVVCEYIGAGEKCEEVVGYMAVYRLGLAIVLYHLLLALLTFSKYTHFYSFFCTDMIFIIPAFNYFLLVVLISKPLLL